ncbi:MAG: sigma-70 family RNA polymerase sigma factor [Candidatus Marinimicrobia bacterium]|nr:sigma-70 family RNA polymerase sigma factor [Candidatus Neomarinimicrobiota bacterium]
MEEQRTEKQLVADAKNGDQSATASLVQMHSAKIYSLAIRIMQNKEDAEDVLQETFIIMMNKLHTFSGKSSLYTWLYRIASNVAYGKFRDKKHLDPNLSPDEPNFKTMSGHELHHWPDHLDDKLDDEAFRNCLMQALEELPENYRTVFVLRDLENMSTRDTANILEISEANVKVRLMRSRLFLRDQLLNHFKCVERPS